MSDTEMLDFLDWCAANEDAAMDFQLIGNSAGFSVFGEVNPETYKGTIRETVLAYHRILKERGDLP